MDSEKKLFGARLKELRENKGLNQEQLAELIGMESRHISRIETGKSFTTIENISKIANALNIEISSLFEFQHKNNKTFLVNKINSYLSSANINQIEIAYKIIKSIIE